MKSAPVAQSCEERRVWVEAWQLCEIYTATYLLTGKQRGPLGWLLYLQSFWPSQPCLYDPSWGSWCQSSQTLQEVSGYWPLWNLNKQTNEEIYQIDTLGSIYMLTDGHMGNHPRPIYERAPCNENICYMRFMNLLFIWFFGGFFCISLSVFQC